MHIVSVQLNTSSDFLPFSKKTWVLFPMTYLMHSYCCDVSVKTTNVNLMEVLEEKYIVWEQ